MEGAAGAEVVEPADIVDEAVEELVVADRAGEIVGKLHIVSALAVVLKCGDEVPLKLVERIWAILLKTEEVIWKCVQGLMWCGAFHPPQK